MNITLKNLLLTICILCTSLKLITAQECGTQLLEDQLKYMNNTRIDRANTNISLLSNNEEKVDLQIAAHIIRDSKGKKGLRIEDLHSAIDDLNNSFEPVNFRFHICSIDYLDDDQYANNSMQIGRNSTTREYQMAQPYLIADAIDIFFLPELEYCGWASFPSYLEAYGKDWLVMNNECVNNGSTLAHEVGHYFNLYHTHQGPSDRINIYEDELVDRSNCGPNVGDELCDTSADPNISTLVDNNCRYIGQLTDSNDDIYTPDPENVMAYNRYKYCRTKFSPQQIDRMQRSYLYDRDYLSNYCTPTCYNMPILYDWFEDVTCQNNASTVITIYKYNAVFNYLDIQSGNERKLYLSNGDLFCSGSSIDACIVELGLTEILVTCSVLCGDICSDANACNFGDAGTCIYGNLNCPDPCDESTCIFGCTDSNACNFNPEATVDNSSCNYGNWACPDPCDNNTCVKGCTDSNACNYNLNATIEDETCLYGNAACPNPCDENTCVEGCTDSNACNYYPNATIDDGTCEYGNIDCPDPCDENTCVDGCTDSNACNYNPNATIEDGTCEYGNTNCPDPCDINTCEQSCSVIFEQYTWLENKIACNKDNIKVYEYTDYWKFIEVQSDNKIKLYLSDGTEYCPGEVNVCKESFGLTSVLDECKCTKDCNEYGCTDENATNYNQNADCEDNSCIYICEDVNACNFGTEEVCEYGNTDCPNPCDESTCPVPDCVDIFKQYGWLNETLSCNKDNVWVYNHNSGWKFIEVQTNDNSELYLDDGTPYCSGSQVEVCKESFGLTEAIDHCVCEDTSLTICNDPNACNFGEAAPCEVRTCADCNNYFGTIFYQDCGGTTFRFIETDDGQIFDPYFHLVEQQAYEGQRIRFDFIINNEEITPCDIAKQAITLTCLQIIEDDIPEPNCNNNTGTIFYADCSASTFRFVETDDGQIYDPYFHLVDLEIYDGQRIKFDFIDNNDVTTPCDVSEKAITITCIEELPANEDCDNVFIDFPWLYNKVDPNNCNSETITVYSYGTYYFIYITQPSNGDLFLDAGSNIFYGQDNGDYSLPEAYNINEIAKWTCGCNKMANQAKANTFVQSNQKNGLAVMDKTFNLYPNPSKGKVHISFASSSTTNNLVTVFDISGKPLLKQELDNITTLDLSHLPKGIYLVEVLNGNNTQSIYNTQSKNIQKLLIE